MTRVPGVEARAGGAARRRAMPLVLNLMGQSHLLDRSTVSLTLGGVRRSGFATRLVERQFRHAVKKMLETAFQVSAR